MSRDEACGSANDFGAYEGVFGLWHWHMPVTSQIDPCFAPDSTYLGKTLFQ